jgi:hypothetical protein
VESTQSSSLEEPERIKSSFVVGSKKLSLGYRVSQNAKVNAGGGNA